MREEDPGCVEDIGEKREEWLVKVYKAMAILPKSGGTRPVGFGGDIQGPG
jgi:hypothetical protein